MRERTFKLIEAHTADDIAKHIPELADPPDSVKDAITMIAPVTVRRIHDKAFRFRISAGSHTVQLGQICTEMMLMTDKQWQTWKASPRTIDIESIDGMMPAGTRGDDRLYDVSVTYQRRIIWTEIIRAMRHAIDKNDPNVIACDHCNGTGVCSTFTDICASCAGSGRTLKSKTD